MWFLKNTSMTEFEKFAIGSRGISGNTLGSYASAMASLSPNVVEERRLNAVAMDVFSRLMMDRIIFLGEAIDDDVAGIVQAQLLYLSSINPEEKISLYINSPGGIVSAGLGIYDTMQLVSAPIATTCTGMAASMAAVLLCAGQKEMRAILPHSRVMIHQPLGGVSGQTSDILIEAKEIEKCRAELYSIISGHTGQTPEKVALDADRNFWMSAQEAKEYGMIDEILCKKS